MTSRTPVRWGRLALSLTSIIWATTSISPAFATHDNQADMQLQTDLSHMAIRIDQAAPMPPGGCTAGYTWHTTYGGCRRQETRSETSACAAGWSGTRTRYRTAYILQANANEVAYEKWGSWQGNCTPPRLAGVVDTIIAKARGEENGDGYHVAHRSGDWAQHPGLTGKIERAMQVNHGTMYGVTIHRPTATLNCVYASGTTTGHGDQGSQIWNGMLMPPQQSVRKGHVGHCRLSHNGQSAELHGSCDRTSGGDSDHCIPATRTVRITATSACKVTTETREHDRVTATRSFNLCK
ncbi:MAG: hypothetical protein JHC61_11575 [Burkholderiaceae bacterium]|nr:hypothetical protein [Burkholderiaceae bacterium]